MLVRPDDLIDAAQRLTTLHSDIAAANATAASSMTNIAAAAQDEVSQNVASLFSTYGQQTYAAVEQHATVGAEQFAQRFASAASGYSSAEASNYNSLDYQYRSFQSVARFIIDLPKAFLQFVGQLALTNPLEALLILAASPIIAIIFLGALASALPIAIGFSLILILAGYRGGLA